jgi:phosphoribosylglycinamide formyltransferase-1
VQALDRAAASGVPTWTVRLGDCADRGEFDRRVARQLALLAPDLVVCAGWMKILGPAALASGPAFVNTHPALLPAFPGAHAVRDALAYGVKVSGATVHFVDAGVDTGPVIAQVAVPVEPGDDEPSLTARIQAAERPLYTDVVGRLVRHGWTVTGRTVTLHG